MHPDCSRLLDSESVSVLVQRFASFAPALGWECVCSISRRPLSGTRDMPCLGVVRLFFQVFCFGILVRRAHAGKIQPCRGKHKPRRGEPYPNAQTGYDGYCKSCFKEKFPAEYRLKQEQRKKKCRFCGQQRELIRGVMCKPCHRSRACHHPDCSWFNESSEPTLCVACESRGNNPQCTEKRCAMACPTHTSAAERNLQLCHVCSASRLPCAHCREPTPASSMTRVQCAKEHCSVAVALCTACSGMRTGQSELTCGPCWIQDGRLCLYCGRTPGRKEEQFRRSCKTCFAARSCTVCHALPPRSLETSQCGICENLALWCPDHTTAEQRSSGLCRACWDAPE